MNELNSEQKSAVLSDNPYVAIIAGPGTGKTKTLVAKIEYLLSQNVAPQDILAITFTNKAAAQMREKVKNPQVFIGTFHSLALAQLKIDKKIASKRQLLKITSQKNLNEISVAKNSFETNLKVENYNKKLVEKGLIDFDDLLLLFYKKLKSEKLTYYCVLVDEFQDTNPLQYKILKEFNAKKYFVIGDPNQSIYSFRGGDSKIFDKFCTDFPDFQKIVLHKNYRSAAQIVKTYNKIFPDIALTSVGNQNAEIYILQTENEYTEANWIINEIKKQTGGSDLRDARDANCLFSDFAIIYRNHHINKTLKEKFLESGIPFQIVGEGSILEDPEIVDLIEKFIAEDEYSLEKLVEDIVDVEKRNYFRSITMSYIYKEKNDFIKFIKQLDAKDYYDEKSNMVTFSTLHASKGLEFDKVFLCACEERIIPSPAGNQDEERRLFYVGMSRAKTALYLTKARKRYGQDTIESPFLGMLNLETVDHQRSEQNQDKLKKYKLKKAQKSLF